MDEHILVDVKDMTILQKIEMVSRVNIVNRLLTITYLNFPGCGICGELAVAKYSVADDDKGFLCMTHMEEINHHFGNICKPIR